MDNPVTFSGPPTCRFCQMTKEFFKEHNVSYTDYNVASDLAKRQEMIQKSGQMGVPVIFVDSDMIVGFDKDKLSSLLGIAA